MHSAAISVRSALRPVEDVLEALAFLADQVLGRDLEVVEEQLVGLVIDHVGDGPHRHALADRLAQVDDEDRHALGLLRRPRSSGVVRASRIIRSECWMRRDPDLLAVDDIAVALLAPPSS